MRGYALISSIKLQVFNPILMQNVSHKYAPRAIQIEIGNFQDVYHFKSEEFPVDQESAQLQEFFLLPNVVCGRYIKVHLLGKPHKQTMDNKFYQAISYFGVNGLTFDQIKEETPSTSGPDFQKILHSLLIKSSCQFYDSVELTDISDLKSVELRTDIKEFDELKTLLPHRRNAWLFYHREGLDYHYDQLMDDNLVTNKDIEYLFEWALENQGISDTVMTRIVLKHLYRIIGRDLGEAVEFCKFLCLEVRGSFVNVDRSDVDTFLSSTIVPDPVKEKLLFMFLPDKTDFLRFHLKSEPQITMDDCANLLRRLVREMGLKDIEPMFRIYFGKFGYTREAMVHLQILRNQWTREVLDKIYGEIR